MTLKELFENIADTLRSYGYLKNDEKIKPGDFPLCICDTIDYQCETEYAYGYSDGFDEGFDDGYDEGSENTTVHIFNMLTNNYQRDSYNSFFSYANLDGYELPFTIYPLENIEKMFYGYQGTRLPKNIDFSMMDCTKAVNYYRNIFNWATNLTYIPDLLLPAIPYYQGTYQNCKSLYEIEIIRCSKDTVFTNPFSGCVNLTTFKIDGVIGNTFSCIESPLTPQTMISVIEHLYDYSGSSTYPSVVFSDECWEALEAYSSAPGGGTWADYVDSLGWLR